MNFKNITDSHTHSLHSFDGSDSVESLVESAVNKGVKVLAVTDHCDIDGDDIDADKICGGELADLDACAARYGGRIKLLRGIELGQGIYRREESERLLDKYGFDFVLGSIHNLYKTEDFYFLDYKNIDVYELLSRYFDALQELCDWGRFDSLAHLTYPLRYICGRDGIEVDLGAFADKIDSIFLSLIKNGKALELNTSGLFQELGDTMPGIDCIKRYRELGGKYLTVGSDSHKADRIAQGIETGLEIALECGFEQITYFENRQPVLIDIL